MSDFTNDAAKFAAANAFREAAIADGWAVRPTYANHEPIESAASLQRDGFKMMVLARDKSANDGKWKYEAEVSIWGPDGLAIKPPGAYDFDAIRAGLRRCNYCNKTDVETERVSFAGRCCAECLPAQRKRMEYPGWTN